MKNFFNDVKGFPWDTKKYTLDEPVMWDSKKRGIFYISPDQFLLIFNGKWFISEGAEWDGVTNFWDGNPDQKKPNYPETWLATLIHDLGCKYWRTDPKFPHNRFIIDFFFIKILIKSSFNFLLSILYYIIVSIYSLYMSLTEIISSLLKI